MSSIWHNKKEKPMENKTIFARHKSFRDGCIECFMWEKQEFTDAIRKDVIAWCYLDDLLPPETELERTRKALDAAKRRLMQIGYLNMSEHGLGSEKMMTDWCKTVALHGLKEIETALEQKE